MTFKWTLKRKSIAAVHIGALSVLPDADISCEFDTETVKDFLTSVENEQAEFAKVFSVDAVAEVVEAVRDESGEDDAPNDGKPARKPRGPNKPKVEAVAPAPMPVPEVAPPAAPAAPAVDDGIPEALRRTAPPAPAAAAAPPPPPLMPAAPPIAPAAPTPPPAPPAAPPTGVLANKIIADLDKRKAGAADGGAALVAWLAAPPLSLVVKGATYDQAMDVLRMTTDEKLAAAAGALGVS